jgi:hypothetical protein
MNGLPVNDVVWILEMRNIQRAHSLDGGDERFVDVTAASLCPEILPRRPKGSQDPRPVESLAGAMLAKAHRNKYYRICRRAPVMEPWRAWL